ncbi:MAG: DUF664 domain-containing protein [Actinobacteria bacterium]|nr:DUF664 domain-containing protein [Actinomycetota bacterium]
MDLEEYQYFVARALRGMLAIAEELGDQGVNLRVPVPGANTATGLITHSAAVVDYWVGALLARRDVVRDRDAEFARRATVAELQSAVARCLDQLDKDLAVVNLQHRPRTADRALLGPQRSLTATGVLLHVLEEVAQHHGQLEVLRDTLMVTRPA